MKLVWCSVPEEALRAEILDTPEVREKAKALVLKEKLDILVHDGECALDAYLRHLAEINGLPVEKPAHRDIADAIAMNPDVGKFVWFLA